MEIKNNEVKMAVWLTITRTGETDENGKPKPRTSYPNHLYKATRQLKKLLQEQIEVAVVDAGKEKITNDDIKWVKTSEVTKAMKVIADKFRDEPVMLTPDMIKAIKHYHAEIGETPDMSDEAYEQFEALIK